LKVLFKTLDAPFAVPNPVNSDTDADELPDTWEMDQFGNLDANPGDPAANGINTVLECYIAGLDPTDPDSVFRISGFQPLTSILQWNAASGRVYTIYWSSNLLNGFNEVLQSNYTGGAYTDQAHGVEQQGFYQIKGNLQP